MVVLVTAQPVLPGAKNFVKALLAEAEKRGVPVTTVVQNYNPRRTSVVLGEDEKVLYGKGFILDTLCGKTYALSPRSFYQVNPVQTAVLYGLAVDAAHLTGKEVALDAYCGIGIIGLTASDKTRQVVGVEVNRDAVRDAIGNAKHNGVKTPASLPLTPPHGYGKPPTRARRPTSSSWTRPGRVRRPPSSRAWPAWPPSASSTSAATLRRWPATSLS